MSVNIIESSQSNAKGKGSFWIPKIAIDILIANEATALQISAFLVLAKHTNEGGKFSTAGITAIHRNTGVSHPVAQKAVKSLLEMESSSKTYERNMILYLPYDWVDLTDETLPQAAFERAETRYVINDFNAKPEDKVWFSNELVTGIGKFTQPLKKLKMCGDLAARILLLSYQHNDLEQIGGINPKFYHMDYGMKKISNLGGYNLWHGQANNQSTHESLAILNLKEWKKDEEFNDNELRMLWSSFENLENAGFIYQIVSVLDRKYDDPEAQVIYELDSKNKHGYKVDGEEGVGGEMAKLSTRYGHPVTDSLGRFNGKYAAIVPVGEPHIVGIYRLRFRVSNTKNHGVSAAWSRIHQGQRDVKDWLNTLLANSKQNTKSDEIEKETEGV